MSERGGYGAITWGAVILSLLVALYFIIKPKISNAAAENKAAVERVDSIQALQKAADSLKLIKEEKRNLGKEELKSYRIVKDESYNSAYFYDKRTPEFTDMNFVYPYISERNGRYWLRMRFQYTADDPLLIQSVTFRVDSKDYKINGKWESDKDISRNWEWYDMTAKKSHVTMLQEIAEAKDVSIRYQGQNHHSERALTSKERDIIKKTVNTYEKLR